MTSDENRITLLTEYEDPASQLTMVGSGFVFLFCLCFLIMSIAYQEYFYFWPSLLIGGYCVWTFKNALKDCKGFRNTVIVDTAQRRIELVSFPRDYSRKKEEHILSFQDIQHLELTRILQYRSSDSSSEHYVIWLINACTQSENKSYKLYASGDEQNMRAKAKWLSNLGGWTIQDRSHENVATQSPDDLKRPMYAQTSVQEVRQSAGDNVLERPQSRQIEILQRQGDAITIAISNGKSFFMNLFPFLYTCFLAAFFGGIWFASRYFFSEHPMADTELMLGVSVILLFCFFGFYGAFGDCFARFTLVISGKGVEAYRKNLFSKSGYRQLPLQALRRISIDGWDYKYRQVRLRPQSKRQVSFDGDKMQIQIPYPLSEADAKWLEATAYHYLRP
jgi:hypothetical protein